MAPDVGWHPSERLEDRAEYSRVSGNHRIIRIGDICVHRSVIRVDYHLDAVAHVVGSVTRALRVWVHVARRVRVENPFELSRIVYDQIRIGVEIQEWHR